jgi:hypothetical protein
MAPDVQPHSRVSVVAFMVHRDGVGAVEKSPFLGGDAGILAGESAVRGLFGESGRAIA